MIEKLKNWLIRLLGGDTVEEAKDNARNSYDIGVLTELYRLKIFADRMNGLPADEWCKKMYDHITESIQRKEHPQSSSNNIKL